ncbi:MULTISPECIES: autotransporter [unclassified Mesorhizobium]|uniref:autotransporter n=1 Tax=unclassified Mesorhizobium TaxID=325217 RepID=UPI00301504D8
MTRDTRAAHLAGVSILALAIGYTIYPSSAQACEATRQPSEGPINSIAVVCDDAETEVITTDYPTFLLRQLGTEYNGAGNDTFTVTGDVDIQQDDNSEGEPFSDFSIDMGAGIDNFSMKGGSFIGRDTEAGDAPIIQLLTGAGNDIITVGAGTFGGSIFAGSGDDQITVSGGTVDGDIFGSGDDDTINVTGGAITGSVFGDDAESIGDDTITISGGTIGGSVFGGGGIDTVTISGNAQIGVAGDGPDSVGLEDGNDIFRMTGGTLSGSVSGNAGNDSITISGGSVGTFVAGNEGVDTIDISGTAIIGEQVTAGEDNDIVTIRGGTVTTFVDGGSGDDDITVSGGAINGDVYGNDGDDTIEVSGGTIGGTLFGDGGEGTGNNTITISGGSIAGGVVAGNGNDGVTVSGTAQIETSVLLGGGNDTFDMTGGTVTTFVNGGSGNDNIGVSGGAIGGDVLGGSGNDDLNISGGSISGALFGDGVEATGDDTIAISGGTITGGVFSGSGADEVTVSGTAQIGAPGATSVDLGAGDDTFDMTGGTLAGSVDGNAGNDTMTLSGGTVGGGVLGGSGNDDLSISGGSIAGALFGDGVEITGDDTIVVSGGTITGGVFSGSGGDEVTVSGTAQIGTPGATSVDLGAGDDTFNMTGGTLAGSVDGNAGNDTMTVSGGRVGGDVLGGDGTDTVDVSGGVINGSVIGGAGTDVVTISGGTIAGDVQGETVNLNGGTIGGDITGISSDTLTINAGTNLNLRDGVVFQGTNAVGTITDTDLARASGDTFRSQNFVGFSSLTVSGGSSSIGFKDGTQTIGNLALLNGSTLYVAGDVSLLAPVDGSALAALVTGTGNVSATNSTITMINNDPTDRFSVGNLTLNGATLGIDINQQDGLGDRFIPAGQFQASGTNTVLVNLLGTPVFTGVSIIPIAPVAGEVVPTTGAPSPIFLVGGIPNTPGSLFAYDVITGSNGGIYLRALPSDLVSPQATRVAIDSQPIETVTAAIEQITDDALAFALDFPKGSGRSDAAPGFGVYASGQFAAVSHDGFTVSDGTSSLQGPPFTAHDFSLAGSVELDVAKYYGFDQTYGLNVGLFGGYASSDVTMDSIQGLGSIGNADNKSGMIGTYGLFRTGMTYGLVSATTFIGQTDINNDILASTGNYDTVGYALTGSVGHIFPLGDKWKFDLRGGALWATFEGDAFTDSQGNEFGKSKVSFGALKFEPGFYGDFALDNGMAISPYARLELQQRIGYRNTGSIAGLNFEFDDADFSVALSSGLNLQLSKTTTLSGELKTKFSSDSQSLAGKIGIKAKF